MQDDKTIERNLKQQYHLRTYLMKGDEVELGQQLKNMTESNFANQLKDINLNLPIQSWRVLQSHELFISAARTDEKLSNNIQKNLILLLLFSQHPQNSYEQLSSLIVAVFYTQTDDKPNIVFEFMTAVLPNHLTTLRMVEPTTLINFIFHTYHKKRFSPPISILDQFVQSGLLTSFPECHRGFSTLLDNNYIKIVDIDIPGFFKTKRVQKNALFLQESIDCIDLILHQGGVISNDHMMLLTSHPEVALKILDEKHFEPFIRNSLDQLANQHFSFAVKVVELLMLNRLSIIPKRHCARSIANKQLNDLIREGENAPLNLWERARLFLAAKNGNQECLILYERLSEDKILLNQLYFLAYQAGNISAGVKFAGNLYHGNGILPDEQKAIDIYMEVACERPEYLTCESIMCIVEPLLLKVKTLLNEIEVIHAQNGPIQLDKKRMKEKIVRFNRLQDSFTECNRRFFKYIELVNPQTSRHSSKEYEKKWIALLECLFMIMDLKCDLLPRFKEHQSLLEAHAIMIKILVEQKENYSGNDWRAAMQRSLKYAWNYDQLENYDIDIARIISGVKNMPGEELEEFVRAMESEIGKKYPPA